jgi:dTDP-4-dehydrorhamnose 3,5-epimerase
LDVVLDLRRGSPTFGQVEKIELSEDNKRQFYVPKGFAHGFSVLSSAAVLYYKCDEFYHPESEGGILYNDPTLDIDWQVDAELAIVSAKDKLLPCFADFETPFTFEP